MVVPIGAMLVLSRDSLLTRPILQLIRVAHSRPRTAMLARSNAASRG
jgi:hypothetical protein